MSELRATAHRKMKDKYRDLAYAHYGPNCACCGESNIAFLVLDHIYGKGDAHRKIMSPSYPNSGTGYTLYRWLFLRNWPPIVQVLCANCNTAKTRGVCPHGSMPSYPELSTEALLAIYNSPQTVFNYGSGKTHCVRGHERTLANTAQRKNSPNKHYCRRCACEDQKKLRERKKLAEV